MLVLRAVGDYENLDKISVQNLRDFKMKIKDYTLAFKYSKAPSLPLTRCLWDYDYAILRAK